MRKYSKVSPRIWTGTLGELMRGDQAMQIVALYLATCPHQNLVGILRLPIAYIEADTGLCRRDIESALDGLEDVGYIQRHTERDLVWVVEYARHELGDRVSAQQTIAVARFIEEFVGTGIASEFAKRYPHYLPLDYPIDRLSIGRLSPDQEQEQEPIPSSLRSEGMAPKPARAGSSRPPLEKPTREQLDAMKDALAGAIGYRPATGNKAAWGPFQSAAASLIAEGAKPEDVQRVAKAYRREWPDVELTAPALAKHWARFSRRKKPEHNGRTMDPRTEADLLLQEAWQVARGRKDLDDAKREQISEALMAALNHESNPVGAVKAVREMFHV